MLRLACALPAVALAATPIVAADPTPVGVWQDAGQKIRVEIAPCGERLCGKIVWFRWPNDAQGLPMVDLKNQDPALRGRPLLGLKIVYGLRRTGKTTWEDGNLYYPYDGVTYQARLTMQADGRMRLRAYALLPILGKTYIWTRVG